MVLMVLMVQQAQPEILVQLVRKVRWAQQEQKVQ